ncbi:MAG: MG2 domain-containing protein [Crocinitomicaceae bacterium]|nr:MG2 domain-containing protein [Crocinitomicaceae bacterium]
MSKKTLFIVTGIAIVLATSLFVIAKSNKQRVIKVDPGFAKYISGYTSGAQGRLAPIEIEFADPLPSSVTDKELKELFTITPFATGSLERINDRIIQFTPGDPLLCDQLYTVSFALSEVRKVVDKYENFEFQFSTFPQKLSMEGRHLIAYPNSTPDFRFCTGKLVAADYADSAELAKTITAYHNKEKVDVTITHYNGFNELSFRIDSIQRTEEEGQLVLNWNGRSIGADDKRSRSMDVSALGDYKVTNVKVMSEEEGDQYLEVHFSEALLPQQNLNGIIKLEGEKNLNFHIEENTVRVFLSNLLVGEKKLSIDRGIKDGSGYRMKKAYTSDVFFPSPSPRVRLHGNGSILPNSQGLIFPFETVSLKSVDVRIIKIKEKSVHHFLQVNDLDGEDELSRFGKVVAEKSIKLNIKEGDSARWTSHVLDLNKLIKPELGAIYRVGIKFDKNDSSCGCKIETETEDEEESEEDKWSERTWRAYMYSYDDYESWRSYRDDANPCDPDYYDGKAVNRNILASDLGIVFKLDQDKRGHIFVSNMVTAKPISNALIYFYDYTSDLIISGKCDQNGMLALPLKEKPFLLIAKYGNQRGYLKLNDHFTNSTSKFDVEGENLEKAVKGVFYGERGVWRPGDSLFLSFVLNDPERSIPLNHPIQFELNDPSSRMVDSYSAKKNSTGSYVFRTATRPNAKTGYYSVSAKIGNHFFRKTLRVETVKPNRLKVSLSVDASDSSVLQAKWLHGASAQNLRAKVTRVIRPMKTSFAKYPTYSFDSPVRPFYNRDEVIFDADLNSDGEAKIPTKATELKSAPGMLNATYTTRVFEKSGDFSIAVDKKSISPFDTLIGLDTPKMDFTQSLEVDKNHRFSVIALSESGKKVSVEKVHLKIYKIYQPWWSEEGPRKLLNYVTRTANITVMDTMISVKNGATSFDFKVIGRNYGNYLVTLTDLKGKHQTGAKLHFDYPYWRRKNTSGNEHAKMLDFASNKKNYTVGETVKLTIPSPENGRALISIETGQRVVKKFWQSTQKGDNQIAFQVDKKMFPNAYVHVTLVQPHHTTINDRPMRMYGIIPIEIDDQATHLKPVISMKESVRPNRKASVEVKEQGGRKMTYTLAVVDDGLLDITGFRTPNPWREMYSRRSLGVQTWDMYDDVIGAYSGSMRNLISIGGDGWDNEIKETPKANRFKPMVRFIGPFTLEAASRAKHSIDIPNYVGSVRVMVVAQNKGAFGKAQKTVTVKQPVMVLATLPRLIGPTEDLSVPITVFAMEDHVKDVSLEVTTNDFLQLKKKQFSVQFNKAGDQVINVPVKVAKKIGIGKFKVTARSGNEVSYHEIEVDVRAPNPIIYEGGEYSLEPGEERSFPISFTGLQGSNRATFEVSQIIPIGLNKRLDYLIQYPHGCIEQTTSSVFPQLFLNQIMELDKKDKKRISSNIKDGIRRIASFQTADGGFAYWPGNYDSDDWGTNYAGHFLITAEKLGYSVPDQMKSAWVYHQKNAANDIQLTKYNELTQAYRLYTLALSGNGELGAMNRMRERGVINPIAKWRLATAYYLVGQKEVALKMTRHLPVSGGSEDSYRYSYGSGIRNQSMILESLSLMKDERRSKKLVEELSRKMNSDDWYSTQTTAYTLLGISTYYGTLNSGSGVNYSYRLNKRKSNNVQSSANVHRVKYSDKDFKKNGTIKLKNTGKTKLFVKVVSEGIPLEYDLPKKQNNLQLSLIYRDMDGAPLDPKTLKQGMDFKAEVTVTNPGKKGDLTEIALSHLFPNGWEIHNTRLYGGGQSNQVDYQDIRDDRVYSYFDLDEEESKTITIQLNAAYLGNFYHPAIQVETMYDHLTNATLPGKWVSVEE